MSDAREDFYRLANVRCDECGLYGGAHMETCSVSRAIAKLMMQRSAPSLEEYEAMRNTIPPEVDKR